MTPELMSPVSRLIAPVILLSFLVAGVQPRTAGAQLATAGDRSVLRDPVASPAAGSEDAWNMEFVGHLGGITAAVAVQGDYVYAGEGPRLTILDVSGPASPAVVGKTVPMPGRIRGVAVSGAYAYVAADEAGLRMIDVSDPANPVEVGHLVTPDDALAVAVAGNYAYVAAFQAGLRVIDVSDPANPVEVGFWVSPYGAGGVAVAGDYAYLGTGFTGLIIINISDPAHPQPVGNFDPPTAVEGVAVQGDYAYLAAYPVFWVVDVSDPANPQGVGSYDLPGDASARGVSVSGSYAYLAAYTGGLRVVDVSNPLSPAEVGFCYTPGNALRVVYDAGFAYVADSSAGLRVVDVSDPSNPQETDFFQVVLSPSDVTLEGTYAYGADDSNGLRVVDVSDASAPAVAGFYDTPGYADGVAVAEGYAYVADGSQGLRIIDVADPENLFEVGFHDTPGTASKVCLDGAYAYVADTWEGLRVVDVADPANPFEAGFYITPDWAEGVSVAGGYAFVAESCNGLQVIDVSDPTNPAGVGSYISPGCAQGVALDGSYVYLADGSGGLRVVDVADPATPTEVGFHDTPGSARGVAVGERHIYVADGEAGVRVVDVSDPTLPLEIGFFDTASSACAVNAVGDLLYVADGAGGLYILRDIAGLEFSISGMVSEEGGDPVAGVMVSAGEGGSATTDATGTYTITAVLAGTYNLTPALAGWTFDPPIRTVTLPPDATGQDFTAVPECPQPLEEIGIVGPTTGYTDTLYAFTSVVTPANASEPISYTWSPEPVSGQGTDSANYQWADAGDHTIELEAENCGGVAADSHVITISIPDPPCPEPLTGVGIDGPTTGYTDTLYAFTAMVTPENATEPINFVWSPEPVSGQGTDTAEYDWAEPGERTIFIEAENCGGLAADSHVITISIPEPPCPEPLTCVGIDGPASGYTGTPYTFTSVITPASATAPIGHTWSPEPVSGQGTDSATYEWAEAGEQLISLEAENCGGSVSDDHLVTISTRMWLYLPVILHTQTPPAADPSRQADALKSAQAYD